MMKCLWRRYCEVAEALFYAFNPQFLAMQIVNAGLTAYLHELSVKARRASFHIVRE